MSTSQNGVLGMGGFVFDWDDENGEFCKEELLASN